MSESGKLMRVGALAKAVGKSVRALHLYEELGLLTPTSRTGGGFRLYGNEAAMRLTWIIKLQAIGFSLSEIQGFVRDFEGSDSGREATSRARDTFTAKLRETREAITQLEVVENDLVEALAYLESCQKCEPTYTPDDCHSCDHHGHEQTDAPALFAGLSKVVLEDASDQGSGLVQLRRTPDDR